MRTKRGNFHQFRVDGLIYVLGNCNLIDPNGVWGILVSTGTVGDHRNIAKKLDRGMANLLLMLSFSHIWLRNRSQTKCEGLDQVLV